MKAVAYCMHILLECFSDIIILAVFNSAELSFSVVLVMSKCTPNDWQKKLINYSYCFVKLYSGKIWWGEKVWHL